MITSQSPASNKALLFSASLKATAEMQAKPKRADCKVDWKTNFSFDVKLT